MQLLRVFALCLVVWLGLGRGTLAFYLPGVAPHNFVKGEAVKLKVTKLTSSKNQLPYDFYSLPFCAPDPIVQDAENLGEVLTGDRIENSKYELKMAVAEACKLLCWKDYDADETKQFETRIEEEYHANWIVDNLPGATLHVLRNTETLNEKTVYEPGFPIGFKGDPDAHPETVKGTNYINNHVRLTLKYHTSPEFEGYRIVGFEIAPYSVAHKTNADHTAVTTCTPEGVSTTSQPQSISGAQKVAWTYDVVWEWSNVKWASRWDTYLLMQDDQVHWFSIINSLMVVVFLTGMLAMIMIRTLNADVERYNRMDLNPEEIQEETGWKLVHADVFRPPDRAMSLAVAVGFGMQVLAMACITLAFAVAGFLSPANRGMLMTTALMLFAFMGIASGYHSARIYKMLKGTSWKKATLMTAVFFPGMFFFIFFVLDLVVWSQGSTGAVPFVWMLAIMALWFLVTIPLVFLGAYFGYRKAEIAHPTRTMLIPREVPTQVWYMRPLPSVLMGGLLPFGAVFIELWFLLKSIWMHRFYYGFGFLFLVFLILLVTCAEISVVMVYFQLCSEDYHWWWRSFLTSGASAMYMFLYMVFYFATRLEIINGVSAVLYFCYAFILCCCFFCLTGAVGFYSSLWFTHKIYSSVKVD